MGRAIAVGWHDLFDMETFGATSHASALVHDLVGPAHLGIAFFTPESESDAQRKPAGDVRVQQWWSRGGPMRWWGRHCVAGWWIITDSGGGP
jgi:hypothetical protein